MLSCKAYPRASLARAVFKGNSHVFFVGGKKVRKKGRKEERKERKKEKRGRKKIKEKKRKKERKRVFCCALDVLCSSLNPT